MKWYDIVAIELGIVFAIRSLYAILDLRHLLFRHVTWSYRLVKFVEPMSEHMVR
jgi:hypothetical protein